MGQEVFVFRQFRVQQASSPARVGTDGVLLGAWAQVAGASRILDIGTGTGLLALMAAQRNPTAQLHAVEMDAQAVSDAQINFAQSPFSERIQLFAQDFRQFIPPGDIRYDVMVSNPPYFRDALLPDSDRRTHWRHQTQLTTADIFGFASLWLTPQGQLSMVLPADSESLVFAEALAAGLYCIRLLRVHTTPRKPVYRVLLTFSPTPGELVEEELAVQMGGANQYSQAFISLTRDFYPWM